MSKRPGSALQRTLVLSTGAVLLLVSNGRWILAPATWLAPVFLLYYLDRTRAGPGLSSLAAVLVAVWAIAWRGMIPAPGVWYFVATTTYALFALVPFLAHRLIAPRLDGFHATLVFPAAWVVTQYVLQQWITPYGSWGSLAYTQTDFAPFVQLVSVTGLLGLDFFIAWFASAAAWLWTRGFTGPAWRSALGFYGVSFLAVLVFGAVRLVATPAHGEPVVVALLLPAPELAAELEAAFAPILSGQPPNDERLALLSDRARALNDDLLRRSRVAAEQDADFIVWSEHAGRVMPSTEPALLADAQGLVRAHDTTLILGLGAWRPGQSPPLENKLAILDRSLSGPVFYHKSRPIFMAESTVLAPGSGSIAILDTHGRRAGAVICHDLDFPAFLRQAGRARVDLLFAPSADWPEIGQMHMSMARLRAVENGFVLIRPVSGGPSVVVDTRGRLTPVTWAYSDPDYVQIAALHTPTLYARVGDVLVWLSAILLALLSWSAARPTTRRADPGMPADTGR